MMNTKTALIISQALTMTLGSLAVAANKPAVPSISTPSINQISVAAIQPGNFKPSDTTAVPNTQPSMNDYQIRLAHAKELLGKYFDRSIVGKSVKKTPGVDAYDSYIHSRIENAFKKQHQGRFSKVAKKVAETLVEESIKNGFDPLFLMAVIENESSFNPLIRGTSGEIGLMQILPDTAAWIAKIKDLPYHGTKSLEDPVQNIRIGATYIAYLREKFDSHGQLYLAAYNMGTGNVKRYLASKTMPTIYPGRVMKRYVRMYTEISKVERASL